MKILVTGGAGLIGRYVAQELSARGCDVVSLDASRMQEPPPNVVSLIGDVRDPVALTSEIRSRHVERIIHCAAMLQATCEEQPGEAVAVNAMGTVNLLEAASKAGVSRVVLASSIAVYGRTRFSPMDEGHPCEPAGIYASTKLLGEHLGRAFERRTQMEVLSVRYGLVYGPGGVRSKGVAADFRDMLRSAVCDRVVRIPNVDQIVPLTYVSDAALGTVLACMKNPTPSHRVFNISGKGCTLSQVAELLCRLYPGTRVERNDARLISPLNGHLDFNLATAELGYLPTVSFEEGISRTCAYLGTAGSPNQAQPMTS